MLGRPIAVQIAKNYSVHFMVQNLLRFEGDGSSNRINTLFGHPDTEDRGSKHLRKINNYIPVSSKI